MDYTGPMKEEVSQIHLLTNKDPSTRRILVIDDDKDNMEILLEPLRWEGYDVQGVTNEDDALRLIENWFPHLVLFDWMLPTMGGIKVLRKIRQTSLHTSCIFVSNNASTESIIEGLDAGADDYIVKPFVPLELLARIRTHLRIRDLHEHLLAANKQLKELVDIDDLTGLYNMRSVYNKLEYELMRARRFKRPLSVVMMDMDHFKSVNDGHDHLFGSFVLSEVGKIIKEHVRNIDIPARYGGDEFLIILTETEENGALALCERIRKSIKERVFQSGIDKIQLTVSVGVAVSTLGEEISAKEFIRKADHALYASKRSGRNQVTLFGVKTKSAVAGAVPPSSATEVDEVSSPSNVVPIIQIQEKVSAQPPPLPKKKAAN